MKYDTLIKEWTCSKARFEVEQPNHLIFSWKRCSGVMDEWSTGSDVRKVARRIRETSVSFSMCAAEQWVMRSNSWQIKSGVTSSTNKLTSNKVAWLNTFRLISAPKSFKELLLHSFSPDNVILSFQIWCQYKLWFAELEPHFVPERGYKIALLTLQLCKCLSSVPGVITTQTWSNQASLKA